MKLIRLAFLGLLLAALPAAAEEDLGVYRVTDIAVDVTADGAAQVRDKAIAQAQRLGFEQLLERLGAAGKATKATNDGIAGMVKAMEVQKEHVSAKRYTGTLTVQFKPEAVRTFLDGKGVHYSEVKSMPVVVLPIQYSNERSTLWEDRTPWRDAWEATAKKTGLVPFLVPAGDLDDIAKISTEEALEGKQAALQGLMQKYNAGGALVVVLSGALEPGKDGKVEVQAEATRTDLDGTAHDPIKVKIGPVAPGKPLDEALKAGIKHVMSLVEASWRQQAAQAPAASQPAGTETLSTPLTPAEQELAHQRVVPPSVVVDTGAVQPVSPPPPDEPGYMSIDVPVPTLAAWAQIKNRLMMIPAVIATHVVSMTRGLVHIELQFRGDVSSLQAALLSRSLQLEQIQGRVWELRSADATAGGMY